MTEFPRADAVLLGWLADWLQRHYPNLEITEPEQEVMVMQQAFAEFMTERSDYLPTAEQGVGYFLRDYALRRRGIGFDDDD